MDIYKLEFTILQYEILRFLTIKAGKTVNLNQISKSLDVSITAVAKSIKSLEQKELITSKKDEETKRFSIKLNRENQKALQFKRTENLKLIYESGLFEFLNEKLPAAALILFGSYAKGEDTIDSDIDLAIIGVKEKKLVLDEFEKKLDRKIIPQFYSDLNINKNLKENILGGIILKGAIEL